MTLDLRSALDVAEGAAREAGEILRRDLHRAGGPRGRVDKADADLEAAVSLNGLAPAARRPRPRTCWPADALEVAERLLLAGSGRGR